MKLSRKQLRKMILSEMYGMSGQDMRDSGRLSEELTSQLYSMLSAMRMDEADLNMFARALESALARAHFDVKGDDQDYQVKIAPASQLVRDFAAADPLREEFYVGPAGVDDATVKGMKLPSQDSGKDLKGILIDVLARLEALEQKK